MFLKFFVIFMKMKSEYLKLIRCAFVLVFSLVANEMLCSESIELKAFPTAQGYGKYATGGRGGNVVAVTNLQDYDLATESPIPGSFRWAFTQYQDSVKNRFGVWKYFYRPITIIFKVGGVIDLKADFSMNRDSVTIAGQTALGEGICFKGYTLKFGGHRNGIIRFLKSRPGDVTGTETSAARWENGGNFIFDHCSFSWGIEETTHFSSADNFTIQWCLVSESLYNSIHKKGERGYAAQWGGQYSTYHHNLLAHHNNRSPRINGANKNDIKALVDYRNNVNYNWGSSGACYGGEWESTSSGFSHVNFVNNYYKPGPATPGSLYFAAPSYQRDGVTAMGYAKWYFSGNFMEGNVEKTTDNWLGVNTSSVGSKENIYSADEFFKTDGVLENHGDYTETAENAYTSVLVGAGAIYPKRDAIDARVVGEVSGSVAIERSVYANDSVNTPIKGTSSGIIDTQKNLKPEGAGDDWDAWASYYPTIDQLQAPVDSDQDGMPDSWETANALNPNDSTDGNRLMTSGYTALEVYLNGLVGETIPLTFASGVENIDFSSVEIFPNPVKDQLCIKSSLPVQGYSICDLSGRQLASCSGYPISSIDVSRLTSGIYILSLESTTGKQSQFKFVK